MHAPSKRRSIARYLSFPVVVAIVFVLVAKLVALQRADMISELADRVAHRETWEAAAAVRQLAAMPHPPVLILVSAAASADRDVAQEAQHAISKLLRRLQRQIQAERSPAAVARQLVELAESLDRQKQMFSPSDYAWLSNTTNKLLRLANRVPAPHSPSVAVHCDSVLAVIVHPQISTDELAEHDLDSAIEQPFVGEGANIAESRDDRHARLPRESEAGATRPAEITVAREGGQPVATPVVDITPHTNADAVLNPPWQSGWAHPLLRILPALPINSAPMEKPHEENIHEAVPPLPERATEPIDADVVSDQPLAEVDSRELLHDWLHAEGSDVLPIEEELTRRGFGRLSERIVEQLFTGSREDRLRLIDDVLMEPGIDARPWLMLLAEDEDADVRLLAVTIMATSNDPALIEKAWQASIRDRDPRVAGLAGRLRERREGTLRR